MWITEFDESLEKVGSGKVSSILGSETFKIFFCFEYHGFRKEVNIFHNARKICIKKCTRNSLIKWNLILFYFLIFPLNF